MKIGDEVLIHGFVDEIRNDVIIIKNKGGYFGTVEAEVRGIAKEKNQNISTEEFCAELGKLLAIWNPKANKPQSDSNNAKYSKDTNCTE